MKIKSNKRGELLGEETFGNLLAWIGISIVIVGTILVYNNFKSAQKIGEATSSLEQIQLIISQLNQDSSTISKDLLIPNPLNWNLVGYDLTQTRPGECSKGSDCVCLCPKPNLLKVQLELCATKGKCVDVYDIRPFKPILIKATQPNYITLKKVEGEILIEEKEVKNE